jgi:hypothetical protein
VRLLRAFDDLSGKPLKDRPGRQRYRWLAVVLSRSPEPGAVRAAFRALDSRVTFDVRARDAILKNLALRCLYRLFRSLGAESTASLLPVDRDGRILEVMRVADDFFRFVNDRVRGDASLRGDVRTVQSQVTGSNFSDRVLRAASACPAPSDYRTAREKIRKLYLKSQETSPPLGPWERAMLASVCHLTRRSVEEALKVRACMSWTFGDELRRTVVTALYLPLMADPGAREPFVRKYLEREEGG